MILLILLLTLAALISTLRGRRKFAVSFLTVIFLLIVLICWGPLTYIALSGLQREARLTSPQWKSDNLIILLGFGVVKWRDDKITSSSLSYPRIVEAARLYFDCKKTSNRCRILATGGDPLNRGLPEAEAMAHDLEGLNIPSLDIVTETKSKNTFQNARFSRELFGDKLPDQIVLVTSGPHMRRSMLYFSYFFDKVLAAPADFLEVRMTGQPYLQNLFYVDFALHEYAGIFLFRIYNLLGWNPSQETLKSR
jgi:uncharacterized SAM-binding protein YcdF (DUF218 family)